MAQDLGISGFGTRKITVQGLNDKGTRSSRVDQSRRSTEGHVASDPAYRRSKFRGFVWQETLGTTSSDFPIGKSPTQEKVDPLTIGVRDLEGSVHGATGLANSRPANSRFLQVCGPKLLNIASSESR